MYDWEANKPSSVPGEPGEDHFSGTDVAAGLEQPTRDCEGQKPSRSGQLLVPAWPCSGWGLPCHRRCRRRGALLPHRFTLACAPGGGHRRCTFCCAIRRLTTPGRYPAPCPVELGLSSTRSGRAAVLTRLPFRVVKVPRRGLEPPRRLRHQILSLACLPVSAPGHPPAVLPRGLEPPRACAH